MKDIYCAVDIGSSMCHAIVGRFGANNLGPSIEILGTGSSLSQGVKGGSIINIESVSQSISEAMHEAELMSGIIIEEAGVNISGKHLHSDNSRGVVAITNKERTVSPSDVLRVIEGAQNIRIQADQDIIHVLSREFHLDEQSGIRDPVGMSGIRLEAEVHIVTAGITALTNLHKAIKTSGLSISAGIMSSLASAEALLLPEEKDLGIALVDIGSGVTDLILYADGGVCYSSVLPIGGMHVTQDLSIGLKVPVEVAEFLKKNYAAASANIVDPTEKIELPTPNSRSTKYALRQQIAGICEARLREIFEMVDAQFVRSNQKSSLTGGVILAGGSVLMEGIEELAEEVLGLSVSTRVPRGVDGFTDRVNTPEFATGVGILHYMNRMNVQKLSRNRSKQTDNYFIPKQGVFGRIKNWLSANI